MVFLQLISVPLVSTGPQGPWALPRALEARARRSLKGPPRLLRCTQLFFPHVLLLATESEVMDTQAQCQTNASEESYSYMEQCS